MLHFSKLKIGLILATLLAGVVFSLPNVLPEKTQRSLPSWLQPVNLGLDLQGGVYLLYEVEAETVIRERVASIVEGMRLSLRTSRIRYTNLGVVDGEAVVSIRDNARFDEALTQFTEIDRDALVQTGEDGQIRIGFSEEVRRRLFDDLVARVIEIVRRRVDEMGVREPSIQKQGGQRIIIEVPGLANPEDLKRIVGKTAKMDFHLVDASVDPIAAQSGQIPVGSKLVPGAPGQTSQPSYLIFKRVEVTGEHLIDSQPTYQDGRPVVSFRFDAAGGKKFGDVTAANVNQQLAVVLDGKVISAPVIQGPILGGSGIITGGFTVQEANDLSLLLRAGALPADLKVLEERTVGPGLGADSVRQGSISMAIGLALVVIFMVMTYSRFGVYANIALLGNLAMLIGALSVLGATLTLPGIAGIVLTMGMAVDANVLIYERMREEARNGRTVMNAIEAGFDRAFGTIFDSNVTTLAAALLLFIYGSGPVRGFAVTLGLGIMTTMFSAIMVTRLLVVGWMRRAKPKTLPI
ncbi:MAG: protein-export membrane protein SecD [Alphaproteobacteria bacterium RIFOXYD12_FULL_60_8]|nr:MAG: protein-export membrane protein SecD [Alphaproteobacteria bacterium RIFOXYD12_FULL_60_8]